MCTHRIQRHTTDIDNLPESKNQSIIKPSGPMHFVVFSNRKRYKVVEDAKDESKYCGYLSISLFAKNPLSLPLEYDLLSSPGLDQTSDPRDRGLSMNSILPGSSGTPD